MELTKTWTDDFEIVLLATVPESIEPHTMKVLLEQSNYILAKYDLVAFGDHPNALPPEDHLDALKGLKKKEWTNGKYALVFIQRLSKFQEASEQLAKLGYYQSWTKQRLERVLKVRSSLLGITGLKLNFPLYKRESDHKIL